MEYERFALVYDSESGQLGRAALSLLESGINVLYAADADEALLLARQERERLGALLVPASLETSTLDFLVERVCPLMSGGVETLVPIGLEPGPEVAASLRRAGVRWCLWEPYEEHELRFVTAAALMAGDPGERRKRMRVPAQLFAGVLQGGDRKRAVVCDLSAGGAYLGLESPMEADSLVDLELQVPPGSVFLRARVAHTQAPGRTPRPDLPDGMGIEFLELEGDDYTAVARLLEDLTAPFRL
ncbi:MAG: hypothetical protein CL910_01135 [Deltaproteobacteria bacterium]|nr:hypothetical protein [Deltaproteobacteria bacterium]